jgi:hypothetical protein
VFFRVAYMSRVISGTACNSLKMLGTALHQMRHENALSPGRKNADYAMISS